MRHMYYSLHVIKPFSNLLWKYMQKWNQSKNVSQPLPIQYFISMDKLTFLQMSDAEVINNVFQNLFHVAGNWNMAVRDKNCHEQPIAN